MYKYLITSNVIWLIAMNYENNHIYRQHLNQGFLETSILILNFE